MALTKIQKRLTENHREFLLSQTPRSTPDNPTESGWSASKIRQYQWQGFSTLFTLLDSVESRVIEYLNDTITTAIDGNSGDIAILTTNISNEVIRATNAEQNLAISITNTLTSANGYTDTKFGTLNEKISNILSGELIAKKAETDSYGRKIQADRYYANLSISVDATTGVMQFKFYNAFGEVVNTIIADTNLERIASIFDYDETTKMLYVIDYKGDRHEIDLSSLIDTYVAENQGHDCIVTIENNGISVDLPTETKTDIAKGVTAYNKAINLEASVADLDTAKADKDNVYTKQENDALLAEKQDTLVSGENIKTINGVSLVGSGNYAFDTALNEVSRNAVQNKVITEYIYDLESKVSTLAVKVYNHDIALGTLNIENVLYSVANADSFAIPTTIGTNADVVIPKSRMALNTIKGKTEYSRNLINDSNISWNGTLNGITYSYDKSTHMIVLNGTATTSFTLPSIQNPNHATPLCEFKANNSYLIKPFVSGSRTDDVDVYYRNGSFSNIAQGNNFSSPKIEKTIDEALYDIAIFVRSGCTLINYSAKLMVVQGSTAPTSFVPYYTGLKNVELNSLKVYGKTDNYTELNVGDKVKAIVFSKVDLNLGTNNYWNIPSWDNSDGFVYWSGSTQSLRFAGSKLPIGVTAYDDVEANKVYVFDDLVTISAIYESARTIVKNATSVKSILPSSILPKTLPAYERLEVVDNGDGTYKIDLVSHAELHDGDEINSLWVGNPQSELFGDNVVRVLRLATPTLASALFAETRPSTSVVYNALGLFPNSYDASLYDTYIDNASSYNTSRGGWISFGGSDESKSDKNCVVKFKTSLSITSLADSQYLNAFLRNGEETRTTLIDGLSLDDVSAVIDTNDIVYADNSNAEYDVSIAETSVELLVNKAN